MLRDKNFLLFLVRFLAIFLFLYYGTLAWIGIAAPGDIYSPFVDKYLDYVSWIKYSLMYGSKGLLWILGIDTYFAPDYIIRVVEGRGVRIAMDCVGYGVYSFWMAYILAGPTSIKQKWGWLVGGLFLLWLINTIRISLFLLATDRGWPMPLGIDHHDWFNIFAYTAIFTMMYFQQKKWSTPKASPPTL